MPTYTLYSICSKIRELEKGYREREERYWRREEKVGRREEGLAFIQSLKPQSIMREIHPKTGPSF